MTTPTGQSRFAWSHSYGLWPGAPTDPHFLPGGIGPRSLGITFDFTAAGSNGTAIQDTLLLDESNGQIGSVQTIFIDNSQNAAQNFTITFGNTGMKISIAKNSQGIFPVFAPTPLTFTALTTGLVLVPCQFLNVPVGPVVWAAS